VAAVVFLALPSPVLLGVRFLVPWVAGVAVFLAMAVRIAVRATPEQTERAASAQDQSGVALLAFVVLAASASLVAIIVLLEDAPRLPLAPRIGYVLLAGVAVAGSWLTMHTMFAFHYAHRFYGDVRAPFGQYDRGLAFPGRDRPDFFDFLYFSFVVAMTSQVSDVQVTTHPMRRLVLIHGIVSFAFYTVILALAVNAVGGLTAAR
jgi:uncharacterized membrane protein